MDVRRRAGARGDGFAPFDAARAARRAGGRTRLRDVRREHRDGGRDERHS